ncbi:MAG: xylulose kinase [Promethearchaeota archaeon]|nr:MAG: xylulose kinase [Candidatus Lokiarchaeota archaeon]
MTESKQKYVLAIDLGTSGAKTAIVSTRGEVVDWEFEEVPLHLIGNQGAEQDPVDWWNAIVNTSKKLIDKGHVPVEDIVGICNSSQWAGTVAVDKNGNHLMNSIIWMDTRGAPYIKKLQKGLIMVSGYSIFKALKWIKITGGAPSTVGNDPIGHIFLIKNQYPDVYKNTYMFLEPQDYVNLRFTGKFAASEASIHMHFITDIRDINNIHYSQKLIKKLKIDPEKLPQLKKSIDILGTIKHEVADLLGLTKETKVVMGAPDIPTAVIGSGAIDDYQGHIYLGTSDWLICHVPYKKTDLFHIMASVPSAIPGRYFFINEQQIAGGALQFLRDKILYHKDELLKEEEIPDVYKLFDRIVEKVPAGSNNLIFTPWLYGERTPIEDLTIRAGLYNLSLEMTREHIIRAIYEGIAYNVRWLLMYVEKNIRKWVIKERTNMTKKDFVMPELNIIGGGAQSNVWCQIFADVLNRKIKQVKNPIQANARGAAFIASVALGFINWDDIPKYTEISNIFTPNPENREIYDKLFTEYINIYKTTRKLCKHLNQ